MRLHPREQQTEIATAKVTQAILDEVARHDLTQAEYLRVLHGAYDNLMSGVIKQQIRLERHDDPDKPGGLL